MFDTDGEICDTEHFLASVRRGPGFICSLHDGRWSQHQFSNTDEAVDLVEKLKTRGNVYVSMGTLKEGAVDRTIASIESMHGLFLDLDCHGKVGDYTCFKNANVALRQFCSAAALPKPNYLVDSGHGLHAHWAFDEPVDREDWELLAQRFKNLTAAFNLKSDMNVTADPARVLRVPGTINFRDPSAPVTVEMVRIPQTGPITKSAFEFALDQALASVATVDAKPKNSAPTWQAMAPIEEILNLADLEDALSYISSDVPRGTGTIIGSDGQPATDYWFGCILSARREYGDAAKEVMRKWSQQSERYGDGSGFEHAWNQYDPNHKKPVTIGSLFKLAQLNGWPGSNLNPFSPAPTYGHSRDSARFRLLDRAAIMAQPPLRWRLKGIFPQAGIGAIYGPSASGKSFLGVDLGISIALGDRWFGHRSFAASVTYIMLEGEAGLRNRIQAWEEHNLQQIPSTFMAIAQPFELADPAQVEELAAVAPKDGVVIIDTLNRAAPGLDENSSQDMGRVLAGMKRLQEITGGLVLIVHHTGKDASKGLRGHSSLFAALDGAIEVERSSNSRCWSAAKVKDGEDGKQVLFKLNVIDLGKDSDGDAVTSCAVSEDTGAIFQAKPPSGKHQIVALSAIRRALGASSSTGQGGAPSGSACLRFEEAVTQSAPELVGVEKKRRAARAREAVQGLISSGHLHRGLDDNEEEWVWL